MNNQFVFFASSICLAAGSAFCFMPAARYWRQIAVGGLGGILVVMGVVLMTTFKWTEVAIKISGLEIKIAEAEKRANTAQLALSERDAALAGVVAAASKDGQAKTLDAFFTKLDNDQQQPVTTEFVGKAKQALEDAGLAIVPASTIPDTMVYQKPINPPQGG
uniref:Uncharacterized protein n=2 Tax=Rhizobium TaxID=379 RepID=A0A179BZB6_RHILE|nr:hypothetical protein [Rhizobium leguminosarum]OAP96879.1 hypothetical protein A4U53_11885 [Rhizobium leguminosarum]